MTPILAQFVIWPGRASAHRCGHPQLHCERARAETGPATGFLTAIQWVLMRLIREIESHPRPFRGLAGTSFSASLRKHSVAWRARAQKQGAPGRAPGFDSHAPSTHQW